MEPSSTATPSNRPRTWINFFLVCGIAAAAVQIAGDIAAAMLYPGYSYADQTVSELSAIGAPTRSFLSLAGDVFNALVLAFAVAVWKTAGHMRAMRMTALLLGLFVSNGIVWSFFPMQQRGNEMAATDIGHIVMAALQVLTIVLFIGFGSIADGKGFRVFSIIMIAAILIAGGVTAAETSRIEQGLATPWIGLIERISFYGPGLWMSTLALVLLRRRRRGTPEDTDCRATLTRVQGQAGARHARRGPPRADVGDQLRLFQRRAAPPVRAIRACRRTPGVLRSAKFGRVTASNGPRCFF